MLNEAIYYILGFLCGDKNVSAREYLCYGNEEEFWSGEKRILIRQSNFFDEGVFLTKKSIPIKPLQKINGIPILFGENTIEYFNDRAIINADLVASTFYLITRYEEIVKPNERDEHGRFCAKDSLLFQEGYLERPIVDEYTELLHKIFRECNIDYIETNHRITKVWLTHDVDRPWTHYTISTAIKTIGKTIIKEQRFDLSPITSIWGNHTKDPKYTFHDITIIDNQVKKKYGDLCSSVYFVKVDDKSSVNDYFSDFSSSGFQKLLKYLKNKAEIGVHFSYYVGDQPEKCKQQTEKLKKSGYFISKARFHYLHIRSPLDYSYVEESGITDDFTMGFADVSGFRLGTCRPVNWINPKTGHLSNLILHHLTIMDATLFGKKYMNLDTDSALEYSKILIERIKEHGGELILLYHNDSYFALDFYKRIIKYITEIQ